MFTNKVCVITGASLGIGRSLSRAFAKQGAKIAFIDKNLQAGLENEGYLRDLGSEVLFFHGDLAEEENLHKFKGQVINRFGSVDILINNACYSSGGVLTPASYDDFNQTLKVCVSSAYFLSQLFLPYFNKEASIINISSTRALMSQANTESYSAAKGAIHALTHALAISLAGKVRVNAISPGWIDTGVCYDESYQANYEAADLDQHPSKRVGKPSDISRLALFLANPKNDFINGENIVIDGGMSKQMIYHQDQGWHLNSK